MRRKDAQCRELLEKGNALSEQYFRIMESLAPVDSAYMQQYQDLCADLEDRTIQLVTAHYALHGAKVLRDSDIKKSQA